MSTSPSDLLDDTSPAPEQRKLPMSPLLALATAAFMGILTEALPAGVLPEMARDMSVSESAMGQALTIYAIATGLSAIPLAISTATWNRKRLLLLSVTAFAVANTVTAISSSYPLTMAFRLIAGVAAAAVWAELVGYARRLAPPHLQGRAIAITMAGVPLALSLGIPVGTFLGGLFGWRLTFGLVTVVSVLLLGWIWATVPDAAGQKPGAREPILRAVRLPGVAAVLFVVAAYVLAHNILYTYIATFLDTYDHGDSRDVVLLVFGIASVVSIWVTGALVDRKLRMLTVASSGLFIIASIMLVILAGNLWVVYAAMILWGLGWGGVTTLLQTAVTDAGGDRGQALLVTTWNSFMAGGGAVGGILLDMHGPKSFPWSVLALMLPVLVVVVLGRRHAFPAKRPSSG
ncbi:MULTISPECIES: MFS transporter [Streptomyces]|uniref:MFS transporter n=1 Tax=Streptomyces glycanivorans TaxID=3033808 RepID=A0ABY9JL27_9ACTN|nr:MULTISPECIES: MFS transporter [unclassified Streptomyces]WSQ80666.1 MFS transporter [Streptomyces sp. NBC_01213]TXS07044.1 MFS transporter [Streptomyces sp. wa22]WLQ67243.1 MFS transporter [Streptomyces sp. Alt3]WSQ87998.1 MFS transporter [Streptomyces sp. NBC_01212]WSR05994.1 MFS transporter [Streptomyces sp. NBC_01208]